MEQRNHCYKISKGVKYIEQRSPKVKDTLQVSTAPDGSFIESIGDLMLKSDAETTINNKKELQTIFMQSGISDQTNMFHLNHSITRPEKCYGDPSQKRFNIEHSNR